MVPRSSLVIRILAGGYITYLGGKLLLSSIKEQPDNYMIYVVAGIAFVIIGLIWLVKSGVKLLKKEYEDDSVMGQLNKDDKADAAVNVENDKSETDEKETDKKETTAEEK